MIECGYCYDTHDDDDHDNVVDDGVPDLPPFYKMMITIDGADHL